MGDLSRASAYGEQAGKAITTNLGRDHPAVDADLDAVLGYLHGRR